MPNSEMSSRGGHECSCYICTNSAPIGQKGSKCKGFCTQQRIILMLENYSGGFELDNFSRSRPYHLRWACAGAAHKRRATFRGRASTRANHVLIESKHGSKPLFCRVFKPDNQPAGVKTNQPAGVRHTKPHLS